MPPANNRWVISLLPALVVLAAAQRITTPASVFELKAGESVDLPCNVEGLDKKEHVVTWMKNEESLTIDGHGWDGYEEDRRLAKNVNGSNHALTITSLKGSDSAYYRCDVMNVTDVTGSAHVIHKLNVIELPSAKIVNATGALVATDQREVLRGENVYVRCHIFGNPLPYRKWFRVGGGRLPMGYSYSDTLSIRNAALSDSGIYACRAITDDAMATAFVEIVVKDGAATSTTTSTDVTKRPETETCETELGCDKFARCVSSGEQQICQCLEGYMGDGFTCVTSRPLPHETSSEEEPATTAAPLQRVEREKCQGQVDCHVLAYCVLDELDSSYYCRCRQGHHGDGFSECVSIPERTVSIEGTKKSAEHPDQVDAPNVPTTDEKECGSADENLETKTTELRVIKITVHLTRNQKLEFISDNEYQAFKMRNPEYFG